MYHQIAQDHAIARQARAPEVKALYAEFQGASAGRAPTIAAFGSAKLAALLDDLVMLEAVGDDFVHRHVGDNVAIYLDDRTGQRVSAQRGEVGGFLAGCYREAVDTGQPLHSFHYSEDGPEMHLWEQLVLPLKDGAGHDLVCVFARPREFHRLLTDVIETLPTGLVGLRHEEHGVAAHVA